VIILAIDTCEMRGGVALRQGATPPLVRAHVDHVDYSEWLLPAVDEVLSEAGIKMQQVQVLAAATGPGSFTGLRVGLTTVKAWAEVYGIPVVGVSRLEAMARPWGRDGGLLATFCDAQRGQVFGAVYNTLDGKLSRVGDEVVAAPEVFLELVAELAGTNKVAWVSPDLALLNGVERWTKRIASGDTMHASGTQLAAAIAAVAEERASCGGFSDPLELDANYVRRSDAEIFWKGTSSGVR
jgi:tRNA threonylcarbamoyladenosine biosynthesis protein TsaB